MSFVFLGEVVHGLVSIVTFLEEAFNIMEVRVKSINYMLQHLEELQELPVSPQSSLMMMKQNTSPCCYQLVDTP
jgi:hypothetical protein